LISHKAVATTFSVQIIAQNSSNFQATHLDLDWLNFPKNKLLRFSSGVTIFGSLQSAIKGLT
jgi:hypothetical protein